MFRIIVFVAALLSGGLAAWMTFAWQPAPVPVEASEHVTVKPAQEVLVAAAELPHGQVLDPASMRWQPWPEEGATGGMIVRSGRPDAIETLEGSIVRGGFVPGEPIRDTKLVPADSGFMSALLSPGKRAIAVRISAENTAGGFILPNDHVDVVHTVSVADSNGGPASSVSRTILRDVRVLAIDQTTGAGETGTVVVGKTATLELTLGQVEIATAAESSGALSLALRSAGESGETEVSLADVPPPPKPEAETVVRLIQSGNAEMVRTRPSPRN